MKTAFFVLAAFFLLLSGCTTRPDIVGPQSPDLSASVQPPGPTPEVSDNASDYAVPCPILNESDYAWNRFELDVNQRACLPDGSRVTLVRSDLITATPSEFVYVEFKVQKADGTVSDQVGMEIVNAEQMTACLRPTGPQSRDFSDSDEYERTKSDMMEINGLRLPVCTAAASGSLAIHVWNFTPRANLSITVLPPPAPCRTSILNGSRTDQVFSEFNGAIYVGDSICLDTGAQIRLADISVAPGRYLLSASFEFFLPNSQNETIRTFYRYNETTNQYDGNGFRFIMTNVLAGLGAPSYANVTIESR